MIVGESVDVWIFCWKKNIQTLFFFERFVQEFGFGCAVSIELSLRTYKFTHKKYWQHLSQLVLVLVFLMIFDYVEGTGDSSPQGGLIPRRLELVESLPWIDGIFWQIPCTRLRLDRAEYGCEMLWTKKHSSF